MGDHEDEEEEYDEDESSENDEDDLLEQLIVTLLNEMNHRMKDMENISNIDSTEKEIYRNELEKYVQGVEERHNAMMKYHELEQNNHLYRELLMSQAPMLPMDVVDVSLDELDHRIDDLNTIKNVLLNEER